MSDIKKEKEKEKKPKPIRGRITIDIEVIPDPKIQFVEYNEDELEEEDLDKEDEDEYKEMMSSQQAAESLFEYIQSDIEDHVTDQDEFEERVLERFCDNESIDPDYVEKFTNLAKSVDIKYRFTRRGKTTEQ